MPTLTVFCIGTDHDRSEQWSLMRALYDLTAATPIEPVDLASSTIGTDAKVLFDGPAVHGTSNRMLDDSAAAAVSYIKQQRPEKVLLFGHSRGAVLCTMIAARTYLDPSRGWRDRPPFYLWLLDIVARTDIGGKPKLDRSETLTAYPNVVELVRVVMEDDDSFGLDSIWKVFPLEDFRISYGAGTDGAPDHVHHAGANTRPTIELHRMPGSHGTGTQVNPMKTKGTALPGGDITKVRRGGIWPIGEVCLINALHKLRKWTGGPTTLTSAGADFAGADDLTGWVNLLSAYKSITAVNPRDPTRALLCNDTPKSKKGELQQYVDKHGNRSARSLLRYGDDWRGNERVVNEHHRVVMAQVLNAGLPEASRRAGVGSRSIGPRATSEPPLVLDELSAQDRSLLQHLTALHRASPATYHDLPSSGLRLAEWAPGSLVDLMNDFELAMS